MTVILNRKNEETFLIVQTFGVESLGTYPRWGVGGG